MNIVQYMRRLNDASKSFLRFMCEYCGAETPVIGMNGVCSNCESMIQLTRANLVGRNPEIVSTLDSIRKLADARDFDGAIKLYDSINENVKDPSYLYAEALLYIIYSNHQIAQINYFRKGFMEENTAYRDKAAALASSAKRLFHKSISLATDEIANNICSTNTIHTLFLSQIKVGDLRGAKYTIEMLGKANNIYLYEYAKMLFNANMGNYQEMEKHAENLIRNESFSVNAFYYIAFATFKSGRYGEARRLLEMLKPSVRSRNVDALLEDIAIASST